MIDERYKIVKKNCHDILLLHRNIYYVVESDNFAIAWEKSTKEEKLFLIDMVKNVNIVEIKYFVTKKLIDKCPYEKMGTRKLRRIGQHLKIKNFNQLNKMTLIEEIKNESERIKKNSKRKLIQSVSKGDGCTNENLNGCR